MPYPICGTSRAFCMTASPFGRARKQIHVHGLAIDPDEKQRWLGKTFNELFGVGFYAGMSICKMPILIIRETLSARGQHTGFTLGD